MPGGVRAVGHDVVHVLDDLLLEGRRDLHVAFVLNRVLGRHHFAGGLDELDRQGSEGRQILVGQLVVVPDEAFRKNPMSEGS